MKYCEMSPAELGEELVQLKKEYESKKALGLKLDMSRGKPSSEQLDKLEGMFTAVPGFDFKSADGTDCRNYGVPFGLAETRKLFGDILGVPAENVIVGGNSSLNLMFDAVSRAMLFGVLGNTPWSKLEKVKFLCPVPGYDRHFMVTELMGIEMINIPLNPDGPDMDMIEALVKDDESVKGMWCVPKFSNPDGYTYSDEVVRRLANLRPKAKDFRIFWDNAYAVHGLDGVGIKLCNIFEEAKKVGNEDIVYIFTSTSKISFPGAGLACIAASDANIAEIKKVMSVQTIGHDKLNQLRHIKYFPNYETIAKQMQIFGAAMKPKFEIVLSTLDRELASRGIGEWNKPDGGYFISLNLPDGCAKRCYELAKEAGVTLTPVGATFPYRKDPRDRNLRIAPSYPPNDELRAAIEILCLCARIAYAEQLTA